MTAPSPETTPASAELRLARIEAVVLSHADVGLEGLPDALCSCGVTVSTPAGSTRPQAFAAHVALEVEEALAGTGLLL